MHVYSYQLTKLFNDISSAHLPIKLKCTCHRLDLDIP